MMKSVLVFLSALLCAPFAHAADTARPEMMIVRVASLPAPTPALTRNRAIRHSIPRGFMLGAQAQAHARGEGLLRGVYGPLAAKVHQIASVCRLTVISGFRPHAHVYGTHHLSDHAIGRAVDVTGDYGCIYRQLAGFEGGYSTDSSAVGHIHMSLHGHEDGRRFAHNHYTRWRYAQRHFRHYARR